MVLQGLEGDVTTNEYKSFIAKLDYMPPPPSNNIENPMVYERLGGGNLHGCRRFIRSQKTGACSIKPLPGQTPFYTGEMIRPLGELYGRANASFAGRTRPRMMRRMFC